LSLRIAQILDALLIFGLTAKKKHAIFSPPTHFEGRFGKAQGSAHAASFAQPNPHAFQTLRIFRSRKGGQTIGTCSGFFSLESFNYPQIHIFSREDLSS